MPWRLFHAALPCGRAASFTSYRQGKSPRARGPGRPQTTDRTIKKRMPAGCAMPAGALTLHLLPVGSWEPAVRVRAELEFAELTDEEKVY